MANEVQKRKNKYEEHEKLKAAYALNMCMVSVSQIIDYRDSYILEQEYDAILNNLNLKQMPKDEALLRIITELLNTITFFRIEDIKKAQIEQKYKQRMKSAIWAAVPSLSVIVSGNPVAIALSLATQIGSGYMNYRREKANADMDKRDAEIELEITAIEQFNALRRELFTTAWRLADEYDFDDEWRLTEKQIKQYNTILADRDEFRKYARLESIAENFKAYPPFWYFYGHTANYIAEMALNRMKQTDIEEIEYHKNVAIAKNYTDYTEKAKEHYEYYYSLCDYNLLREDQLTAQFALEYIDILWKEENVNTEKINKLILLAEKMAFNSFDILQLCAISYLKIGKTDDAARLLKILVNEEYNVSTNAKLLSRIYVSKFLFGKKEETQKVIAEYETLSNIVESSWLFPMPENKPTDAKSEDSVLQERYFKKQIRILQRDYRTSINEFMKSCISRYNQLWLIPIFGDNIPEMYCVYSGVSKRRINNYINRVLADPQRSDYIISLRNMSFRKKYVDLINDMIRSLEELTLFNNYEGKDDLLLKIRKNVRDNREILKDFQDKLENESYHYDEYMTIDQAISFNNFREIFFKALKNVIMDELDRINGLSSSNDSKMNQLERLEIELVEFCRKHSLSEAKDESDKNRDEKFLNNYYLDYSILGDDVKNDIDSEERRKTMFNIVKSMAHSLLLDDSLEIKLLLSGTELFDLYFKNSKLERKISKNNVIAILDDKTKKDEDFVLMHNGFLIVKENKVKETRDYCSIGLSTEGSEEMLEYGSHQKYKNKNVNIKNLYQLMRKLSDESEFLWEE